MQWLRKFWKRETEDQRARPQQTVRMQFSSNQIGAPAARVREDDGNDLLTGMAVGAMLDPNGGTGMALGAAIGGIEGGIIGGLIGESIDSPTPEPTNTFDGFSGGDTGGGGAGGDYSTPDTSSSDSSSSFNSSSSSDSGSFGSDS
jgi:hypothetical protein